MADIRKDADDLLLEEMLQPTPIDDDGFSNRIVSRIRRRIWLRRLALPIALIIGGSIAIKPVSELSLAMTRLLAVMPRDLIGAPIAWLPDLQTIILGAMLLAAGLVGARFIEH